MSLSRKIFSSPIGKIITGGLFSVLIPVLINKLVLDNILSFIGFEENLNTAVRVFITSFILMPGFYWYFFSRMEGREITELKFKTNTKSIILWFIISILIIGISFFLLLLMNMIQITGTMFPELVIMNIIAIMAFVIIEEILFRGILYRIIEDSWGTKIALLASAIIFALLHLGNENTSILSFLSVLSGGALIGILFTYTKSLLVPIAFHFGWNLSQVLLGFGLSGGDDFKSLYLLNLDISGSDILTGGASGVENSILVVFILIIIFGLIYRKSLLQQRIYKNTITRIIP